VGQNASNPLGQNATKKMAMGHNATAKKYGENNGTL